MGHSTRRAVPGVTERPGDTGREGRRGVARGVKMPSSPGRKGRFSNDFCEVFKQQSCKHFHISSPSVSIPSRSKPVTSKSLVPSTASVASTGHKVSAPVLVRGCGFGLAMSLDSRSPKDVSVRAILRRISSRLETGLRESRTNHFRWNLKTKFIKLKRKKIERSSFSRSNLQKSRSLHRKNPSK